MTIHTTLTLPGWQNSGSEHWQSLWETVYGYQRVEQHDWDRPLRGDWITRLEEVVLAQSPAQPITLVAHSLGCLLVAAWAAISRNTHRVDGAFLVAPGDAEREELRPVLTSWSPICLQKLPFNSMVLGSHNDPDCCLARAQLFAGSWGSDFVDYGSCGHINAASDLKSWPDGHSLLLKLQQVEKT